MCLLRAGQPRSAGDAAKLGQFIGQFSWVTATNRSQRVNLYTTNAHYFVTLHIIRVHVSHVKNLIELHQNHLIIILFHSCTTNENCLKNVASNSIWLNSAWQCPSVLSVVPSTIAVEHLPRTTVMIVYLLGFQFNPSFFACGHSVYLMLLGINRLT